MNDQGPQATTGHLDLLEALPIMIIDVDRDGKLLFANKKVRDRLGLPPNLEDAELTLADILDGPSLTDANRTLEALFAGESDVTASWRVKLRSGGTTQVDSNAVSIYENGYPIRVRTYLHDASEVLVSPQAPGTVGSSELKSALKEEQEYTKALIQKSGLMVYILDTKNSVVEINKKMEDVTGLTRETAPTLEILLASLYPEPKYRGIVQRIHENMYKNQHIRETELSITTTAGEVKHVSWSTARLKNARGQVHGFIAMGIEVSEKKRLEQWVKLQSSCFDRVTDAVVVTDLRGQIINWVGGSERMLGVSAKEMVGKPLFDLFPVPSRPDLTQSFQSGIEAEGKWSSELLLPLKDSREIFVRFESAVILNEKNSAIAIVSIVHDITREKQLFRLNAESRAEAEEYSLLLEQRDSELSSARARIEDLDQRVTFLTDKNRSVEQEANRLASGRVALEEAIKELSIYQLQIQNTTTAAVITLDTSGIVMTWSRGAEELTRLASNEACNRHQDEVFKLEEFDWDSLQSEAILRGQAVVPCTLLRADGSRQQIALEVSVLSDEENRPIGFAEIALCPAVPTDLEKELLRARNQAMVGDMVGGFARRVADTSSAVEVDFRRMREYVVSLKKVLELYRNGAQNRDVESYVRRIDLGAQLSDLEFLFDECEETLSRTRQLAHDMDAILPGAPDKTDIQNLNEIVEAAVSAVSEDLTGVVQLEREYGEAARVNVNRSVAMRSLMNLLLSGLRAFSEPKPERNQLRIRTQLDGNLGLVQVVHNGRPNPAGISEKLGDLTYLAASGGLGLLALGHADALAKSMGATLKLDTLANGDTQLLLSFKVADALAVEMPDEPKPGPRKRLLFIDDDVNQLRSYRRFFEGTHEVFQAETVAEALKILSVRSDLDAVVTDVLAPEELGLKLLNTLAEQYSALKRKTIVLLPPAVSASARAAVLASGRVVLEKPIHLSSLKTVIDLA